MYVITGATGNTGTRIAEDLLAAGKQVRAVGRSAERLRFLEQQGAETFVGSLEDVTAMARAFDGAEAAYVTIPPLYTRDEFRAYQNRIGQSLADALSRAKVPYAVSLSSVGAHLSEGVGPIKGLHDFEQYLNQVTGLNVRHVRPAFFMENFLLFIDVIKRMGIATSPLREDLVIPMIAVKDVAAYATERLLTLDFSGQSVHELLGERDLGIEEAVQILGLAIGQPRLPYAQCQYADYAKGLRDAGFSVDSAATLIEMYHAFNDGILKPLEPRSSSNTTPTRFELFAQVFAAVYNQGGR
jgi:uncharacterized protein YbjT (DUF2867 family)